MGRIRHRCPSRHKFRRALRENPLPLFDWADRCAVTFTVGGAYLCRRKHIRPVLANVVAELAGIGGGNAR